MQKNEMKFFYITNLRNLYLIRFRCQVIQMKEYIRNEKRIEVNFKYTSMLLLSDFAINIFIKT